MVERQARDVEVQDSNPGPGSKFSPEFEFKYFFPVGSPVKIPSRVSITVAARPPCALSGYRWGSRPPYREVIYEYIE